MNWFPMKVRREYVWNSVLSLTIRIFVVHYPRIVDEDIDAYYRYPIHKHGTHYNILHVDTI